MLVYNEVVFDENLSGTSNWYTSDVYSAVLASADYLRLIGLATQVTGTGPTVTIVLEHSADGQTWVAASTLVNAAALSNNLTVTAQSVEELLGLARLRITLGGTSPTCRLRVGVTGRAS